MLSVQSLSEIAHNFFTLQRSSCQHKGSRGRVAVIGGSIEYTGAPFFAATSCERSGADVVHIFCHPQACIPIKSYSPTLIVHPLFEKEHWNQKDIDSFLQKLTNMHAVVLGPGLSTSEIMVKVAETTIEYTKKYKKPLVVDADVFRLPFSILGLLRDHPCCIMTPNVKEVELLSKILKKETTQEFSTFLNVLNCTKEIMWSQDPASLKLLDGQIKNGLYIFEFFKPLALLIKQERDIIITSEFLIVGMSLSCLRRCGGQGDLLTGTLAATLAASQNNSLPPYPYKTRFISEKILCVLLSSCITRFAAVRAEKSSFSYISAINILNQIQPQRFSEDVTSFTNPKETSFQLFPL